jgi:hypothetical protein
MPTTPPQQSFSNIPLPPNTVKNRFSFPDDLVTGGRNYYTSINFMDYRSQTTLGSIVSSLSSSYVPSGSVILPIPKKLNDIQTVIWNEVEGTSLGGSVLQNILNAGSTAVGPFTGISLNPLLWMTFKNPSFKEHTLQWSFAPNNEAESGTVRDIVNFFKYNMLPAERVGGVFYDYPSIAMIKFHPSSEFTFRFKPCAIISAQIDYTGAGGPSFFKNGAPTVVNLSIQLKEIELWSKNNYYSLI